MKRNPSVLLFIAFLTICSLSSFHQAISITPAFINAGDTAKSQDFYLEMRGNVRKAKQTEKDESKALDSALVTIYSGGVPYSEIWTNKKGKCTFKLPLDKVFTIEVSKAGFVSKIIETNTKVPSENKGAFNFSFDIEIFEEVKNLDVSVLQKPIAKVAYNITMEQFAYDVGYTSKINADLKKMYRNYYMLQKIEADTSLADKHTPAKAGQKK